MAPKRTIKQPDGFYHKDGKKYSVWTGSRHQVWNGTAYRTSGGLNKSDLVKNKWNRIVSVKKQKTAKAEKRLLKYGYGTKKGKFGYVKMTPRNSSRRKSTESTESPE